MKINYYDCEWKFKPEAGYGCNCPDNTKGKCTPSNKMPNEEDECEYAVSLSIDDSIILGEDLDLDEVEEYFKRMCSSTGIPVGDLGKDINNKEKK